MALIVVDASVVAKWFLLEPGSETARALLKTNVAGENVLIAPHTLLEEVCSLIAKRFRIKLLTEQVAKEAFTFLMRYQPVLLDLPTVQAEALDIALKFHISFWDAIYLALAISNRCDLITADKRLYAAASRHYPFVVLLGSR